ncbi:MAG TPA: hypothetical protein VHK90_11475 [Thermoanaerobaculia bacterium]|nr:hypothetical protein [Thermoanaerobaculia bacterium]
MADPEESVPPEMAKIYRREALEARIGGPRVYGDLIRVSPRWVEWAFWILVAFVAIAGIAYGMRQHDAAPAATAGQNASCETPERRRLGGWPGGVAPPIGSETLPVQPARTPAFRRFHGVRA